MQQLHNTKQRKRSCYFVTWYLF